MPIVQVPYGSANLLAQSDYQRINNLLATNFMNVNKSIWEDAANNIVQGAVFQVGGTVYYANAATAIGGVASDYIKLTPGGVTPNMTLTPSYVANLAGVTWNSAYNGYYDVGGNAYVFDELIALQDGEITIVNTKLWKAINTLITGNFEISGDHEYSGDPTFSGNPDFQDSFAHGRKPTGYIEGANKTENNIFDALDIHIPNINDTILLHGGFVSDNGVNKSIINAYYAIRNTSTRITLHTMLFDDGGSISQSNFACDNGDATVIGTSNVFGMSW